MTWKIKVAFWKLYLKLFGPGKITAKGGRWQRGGKDWDMRPIGLDWAVQPTSDSAFRALVRYWEKRNVDCFVAYASPGIGKPHFRANSGGPPYDDNKTLKRNKGYRKSVIERAIYANRHGISLISGNFFWDTGVYKKWPVELLIQDELRWIRDLEDFSIAFMVVSEYDEQGSGPIQAALRIVAAARNATPRLCALHPVTSSAKHRSSQDFIVRQGWSLNGIRADKRHGKAVINAEDQHAPRWQQVISRYQAARAEGVPYAPSNRNYGLQNEPQLDAWCRGGWK